MTLPLSMAFEIAKWRLRMAVIDSQIAHARAHLEYVQFVADALDEALSDPRPKEGTNEE
jgi:hypothetical protein